MAAKPRDAHLTKEQKALQRLLELPENRHCADCNGKAPTWASFNLGAFMCMDCSGVHRMIGTHVTKVRSTTLDKWEPITVELMARWGNLRINACFEAALKDRSLKPRPTASMDERERFIRAKYERRTYAAAPSRESLARAAAEHDMSLEALPPGYMEGIATGPGSGNGEPLVGIEGSGAAATGGASAARTTNPALLRRQQKRDADEAEIRAEAGRASEAAAAAEAVAVGAARTAAAAENARVESARVAAAAASTMLLGDVFGGPAPACPTTTVASQQGLFEGLQQLPAVHQPQLSGVATPDSTGFSFMGGDREGGVTVPASSGFGFLSGGVGSAAAAVSAVGTSSAMPSGSVFQALDVQASVVSNAGGDGSGGLFGGLSMPSAAELSSLLPVAVLPSPAPASAPLATFAPVPTLPVLSDAPPSSAAPTNYARLFSLPLPDTIDGVLARQAQLGGLHARVNASLLADMASRQRLLNDAYSSELQRLQAHLTRLATSNGGGALPARGGAPFAHQAVGGVSALDAAMSALSHGSSEGLDLGFSSTVSSLGGARLGDMPSSTFPSALSVGSASSGAALSAALALLPATIDADASAAAPVSGGFAFVSSGSSNNVMPAAAALVAPPGSFAFLTQTAITSPIEAAAPLAPAVTPPLPASALFSAVAAHPPAKEPSSTQVWGRSFSSETPAVVVAAPPPALSASSSSSLFGGLTAPASQLPTQSLSPVSISAAPDAPPSAARNFGFAAPSSAPSASASEAFGFPPAPSEPVASNSFGFALPSGGAGIAVIPPSRDTFPTLFGSASGSATVVPISLAPAPALVRQQVPVCAAAIVATDEMLVAPPPAPEEVQDLVAEANKRAAAALFS